MVIGENVNEILDSELDGSTLAQKKRAIISVGNNEDLYGRTEFNRIMALDVFNNKRIYTLFKCAPIFLP